MKTLTFDNNKMNASKKQKLIAILLAGVLSLSVAFALSIANAQTATGANSDVTFSSIKMKDGGTITVNGGHALTYVGGKLISAETSKSSYLSSAVDSVLSTWTLDYYANDPVLTSITNNNKKPTLMSVDTFNKVRWELPTVKSAYWLSDTKTWHGINMQAYRTKANAVPSGTAITGVAPDGTGVYSGTTSYETVGWASNDSVWLGNFVWPAYTWAPFMPDLNSGKTPNIQMSSHSVIENWNETDRKNLAYVSVRDTYQEVYNNPYCIEDHSKGYYKTTFKSLTRGIGGARTASNYRGCLRNTFYSKIVWNNGIPFFAIPGERNLKISKGDTLFSVDIRPDELTDPTGFEQYTSNGKTGVLTYYKSQEDGYSWGTASASGPVYTTYGGVNADNYAQVQAYDKQMYGTKLTAARYAVRASYDVDSSRIAFFRDSTSGASPVTDKQLGSTPDYTLGMYSTKKTVLKRTDVTVSLDVNKTKKVANKDVAANFATDRDANRDQQTIVKDGVVQVPWKSSTLTVKNVSTTNSTHISALASTSGGKRYGLVASANATSVDIDLTTLMDVSNTGDEITISLYAENISKGQTSDSISQTPVTFKVKIIPGRQTNITYDFGTNGTGTLPNNSDPTKTLAGTTYAFGDGSNCYTKTGDPFSCWKVTYTLYDGETKIEKYFSGEQFVVPDTVDGKVLVTATYASMDVSKSTSTTSTVCTVTWNLNKPKDATSTNSTFKLDGSTTATWKNTRGIVTMPGSGQYKIDYRTIPVVKDEKNSWKFVGWSTNPNATTGDLWTYGTTVVKHEQFYAIWQEVEYTITWDLKGSSYSGSNFKLNGQSTVKSTYKAKNNYPNAQNLINPGTPTDNSGVWEFDCWKDSNGNKVNFDQSAGAVKKVTASATYYASWNAAATGYWMAPPNVTLDNEAAYVAKYAGSGQYKSASQIKSDVEKIKGKDKATIDEYTDIMNNDKLHLYTTYSGYSGADKYVEFRVVNVGAHNNDGSGLTFMSTHVLPNGWVYSTATEWKDSSLRTSLQDGGSIYKLFDSAFTKEIKTINTGASNDKLWIPSIEEISTTSSYGDGETKTSTVVWDYYKELNYHLPYSSASDPCTVPVKSDYDRTTRYINMHSRSGTDYDTRVYYGNKMDNICSLGAYLRNTRYDYMFNKHYVYRVYVFDVSWGGVNPEKKADIVNQYDPTEDTSSILVAFAF